MSFEKRGYEWHLHDLEGSNPNPVPSTKLRTKPYVYEDNRLSGKV